MLKIIFISKWDRAFNGQEYVDGITDVEQGGKLEDEALEEFYIFTVEQNAGEGNYQIITKIKEMKKLVEKGIAMRDTEEKTGKFAEDPHVQIQKKPIQKSWYNNRVEQSGLIVKKTVQDQGIPQAQSEKKSRCRRSEGIACVSRYFSQPAPPAKA